jgi:transposase
MACSGARDSAMSRVEVLPGPERRRRWSAEQKRSIVAEAFAPGASVCEVARRRDVVAGQIYRWRNELRTAAAGFTKVVVAAEPKEQSRTDVPAVEIELGRDNSRAHWHVVNGYEYVAVIFKPAVERQGTDAR